MEVGKKSSDSKVFDRWFLAGLSVFLVLVVMLYVAAVTFMPIPPSGAKYADMAVPLLLGSAVTGVAGYWFGSSKSSESKSANSQTPPAAPPPN